MKKNETVPVDLEGLSDEISVFIEYSVVEEERAKALDVLRKFKGNAVVLAVLRDFYTRLPEFREEAVAEVTKVVSRMDCYLFQLTTATCEYLYLYNGEAPVFIGEKKDGLHDADVLGFFGYSSSDELQKTLDAPEDAPEDGKAAVRPKAFCPACSAAEGEFHEFGCPVEVCPWCGGQLTYCNCRFDRLGVDEITSEEELERFEMILNEQGRIRFSADQAPSYPEDREPE